MTYAGLKKVIAINSYQKKKMFSEYDFDSPTQLTGDNGAGKTSLLRLIPFFYGANGSQIVRKSNVNKPFAEWYLPYNNSYIVFEYTTARGQIAHVICYRNLSTKGGIVYLFVRGEFEQSVLIKQDHEEKPYAIACTKLVSELNSKGIDYESRITSVKEYREIIQNINAGTRNNKYLNYSLCFGRNDVRHIEKITAALISGEFNMADTKALFLDILEQGNSTLEFGVDASKIERWCDDYKGLISFLDKKNSFIEAIANNKQIAYLTGRLANALLVIREESDKLAESLSTAHRERSDYIEAIEKQVEDIRSQMLDEDTSRDSLQRAVRNLNSEIEVHYQKLLKYEENDYPELSIKLKQLPSLEDKLSHQRKSYAELETKVTNVKDKRDRDLQNLESKFNDEKSKLTEQKLKVQQEAKEKQTKVDDTFQQQLNQLSQSNNNFAKNTNKLLIERRAELATQEQRLKNPDIDQLLIEQREQLESEKDKHQDQVNVLNQAVSSAEKEEDHLRRERTNQLSNLETTCIKKRNAEEKLKLVSARLDPESGTLFSFLETHKVGWQCSPLGKVLTDDLLMDTTLAPSMTEDSGRLFDLSINTSNLPDCTVTNQADREEQANLIDLIDTLEESEVELNGHIKKIDAAIKDSNIKLAQVRNELRNTEHDLAQAKRNLENKKIEITRAKETLVEQISSNIKSLKQNIFLIETELSETEQHFKESESKLRNDRLTQISTIETALEINTEAINNTLDKNHQMLCENRERIKIEYEQRLSEQGVSRDLYQRYKTDIELIETEIENLKAKTQDIKEYEVWLSIYNIDDPKRRNSRNDKLKELESVNQSIRSFETKLKELRSETHRIKQQFKETIDTLENRKKRADSAIYRLSNFEAFEFEEQIDEDFNYNGDLNSILSEVESKLPELEKLSKQRKKDIQQMEVITLGLGDGELYRFWNETSRNTINEDIVASDSKRIDILEKIMNDIIPQVTNITIDSAVNMGRMLVDFKDRLLSFDRDIKKLGRNVSEQVKVNNTFSVVGSIDINVESSLSKLQGWQDIINFSEIYEEWDRTGAAELPTKEFFNALDTLTYHISADKVKKPTELFDIKFEVIENNQRKTAKTDKDMRDLASNGTNLLIQSMLYLALLTQQRGASRLSITYPTDEIGKLTAENQAKLLKMMDAHSFNVVAAQPDGNNRTANLFKNLYHLTPDKNIFNKPKVSKLALARADEASTGAEV
ncbi:ATP-binding protein [Vibrio parahaemolyticus]|nr:ATP-binding protein [Vibrio parahaemolyticus]HCE4711208.1 ATP-binding protein [Vibrio parahaemolyticus]HCG9791408.1 ATP-binding protein [Vibrio parahaemolyticus]HCH4921165.1 ATP-binding protein [Vibrio parahaemolyticus]